LNKLAERLRRAILATGPISVADYMGAALGDPDFGYYRRGDPFGAKGDFTTAPEISQLFGELIGAWLVDCWQRMGRPEKVALVELGPGRGTLMADALRATARAPGWRAAFELHLVETSPPLRRLQAESLSAYKPTWHESIATIPDRPLLLVANEFFDAMPIRQLMFHDGAWRERLVAWSEEAGFHFTRSADPHPLALSVGVADPEEGAVFEISPASIAVAAEIGRRVREDGGAALIVDYGHATATQGSTLRAIERHTPVGIFDNPGESDLSAFVDFSLLARAASDAEAAIFGPCPQGVFMERLGIGARAESLKSRASPGQRDALESAVGRLTGPGDMGTLFKVAAIAHRGLIPAGFIESRAISTAVPFSDYS
jgi:NADH dehydrogenase [ubiquinone] 1 alpha subcomplex assembly factor 7